MCQSEEHQDIDVLNCLSVARVLSRDLALFLKDIEKLHNAA